jgi:PAS domain S-box-containing protein
MLEKALVVDNNELFLKIFSHTLQSRGLQVLTATDGVSALEILEEYRPDIIFTDLIMPHIDGEKLCRMIRKRKQFSSTLLIVVSAVVMEENVDFCSFGADACIAKGPMNLMLKSIESILLYAQQGRSDLIIGGKFGTEDLVPRSIEKELIRARRHTKLIFDNIDNGIVEFSDSGTIIDCNSYVSRLFNRDVLDMLAGNICDLFSEDEFQHVSTCLGKFKNTRVVVESEHPINIQGKDLVFKFVPMAEDSESFSIMIIKDISEEKRARDKLKESLAHLENLVAERTKKYEDANRELQKKIAERKKINEELEFVAQQWSKTFDTISDFVSIHDKDMKFLRVNKSLAKFFGKEPRELIGRYCYEVMHGCTTPLPDCPHAASLKEGKPITFEVNSNNIGIPLLVTCSPFLHDDGSVLGTVHVARDISEQKKSRELREELIKKLTDSLAKVKLLSGFIPICASCKKIRNDKGYWQQVEEYIRDHSEAEFSHGLCPDCVKKLYPDLHDP